MEKGRLHLHRRRSLSRRQRRDRHRHNPDACCERLSRDVYVFKFHLDMTETPALEIRDLKKTYAAGTVALRGVPLTVPMGHFSALLGPNGAGKTTIIGIVTSLVNKTSGSVQIFGNDIDKDFEKAKTHIGLVGQEVNFNPFEKPLDIVVNQAGYYGIPRSIAVHGLCHSQT